MQEKKKILIICGPTASGKSYLAHHMAKLYDGEIINSDSMQIYKQIPIITASPSKENQTELPYHLYNFLDIDQEFSVIKYVAKATSKIKEITSKSKLAIIVGGTGLYINSLIFGYNEVPDISGDTRQYVRELQASIGQPAFFNELRKLDSIAGQKLNQLDIQRSIRAYEVFMETGRSVFDFQESKNISPLINFNIKIIFLHPEREFLYTICNNRLDKLFKEGAIEEVTIVIKDFPRAKTSGTKAIGMQEIKAYLNGTITLQEAIALSQARTRQYAKRQITWFKNQIEDKITLEYSDNKQFKDLFTSLSQELFV
ncbi:MAG: tRNA (adenosine(37)-N6)-dimethylallyltransferase MiaA [Rickettsia endosymbiont of Bryobia graminum]|nr:tRNA (adenosine(37)-N6)-dimethylallyltransferase MiaA [Rickettsia endosymbiont of Bryobia graminum]